MYLVRHVQQVLLPSSSPEACWLFASRQCLASRQRAWSATEFSQIRGWGQSEVVPLSVLHLGYHRLGEARSDWIVSADLDGIHKSSQ